MKKPPSFGRGSCPVRSDGFCDVHDVVYVVVNVGRGVFEGERSGMDLSSRAVDRSRPQLYVNGEITAVEAVGDMETFKAEISFF